MSAGQLARRNWPNGSSGKASAGHVAGLRASGSAWGSTAGLRRAQIRCSRAGRALREPGTEIQAVYKFVVRQRPTCRRETAAPPPPMQLCWSAAAGPASSAAPSRSSRDTAGSACAPRAPRAGWHAALPGVPDKRQAHHASQNRSLAAQGAHVRLVSRVVAPARGWARTLFFARRRRPGQRTVAPHAAGHGGRGGRLGTAPGAVWARRRPAKGGVKVQWGRKSSVV